MRVIVDRDRCEGYGRCVEVASDIFALDDDGMSTVIVAVPGEEARPRVEQAVRLCPRQAIALVEDDAPAGESAR